MTTPPNPPAIDYYATPPKVPNTSFWITLLNMIALYILLALTTGFTFAYAGAAMKLSDKWESMYAIIPIALASALTVMLFISWKMKSKQILLATFIACITASASCFVLAILEQFTRDY